MRARTLGRIRDGERLRAEQAAVNVQRGLPAANLNRDIAIASDRAWYLGDRRGAAALLDRATAQTAVEKLPPGTRPFTALAVEYARAGQPDKARHFLAAFDRSRRELTALGDSATRHSVLGAIAMAERRYDDAIREIRASDNGPCIVCVLPELAEAYDLSGRSDSAIAIFERYINTPESFRIGADSRYLAVTHKRLGELYEAKNDRENALSHYLRFVDLWKNADPELQPRVAEVRRRISRLKDTEAR